MRILQLDSRKKQKNLWANDKINLKLINVLYFYNIKFFKLLQNYVIEYLHNFTKTDKFSF